jgi:16S rRNA (cytosine967-C5)-methyltransferase
MRPDNQVRKLKRLSAASITRRDDCFIFCYGCPVIMKRPIPLHVARKMAEIAPDIVRHIHDAVAAGQPADSTLANHFRSHRELGSRDRRFLSDLVFSYFRWRGWTQNMDFKSALILSHRLDAIDIHPAIAVLADPWNLHALGEWPIDRKAAEVGGVCIEGLVPAWLREVLDEPDIHLGKCIEAFQKRPPTWWRLPKGREQELTAVLEKQSILLGRHEAVPRALAVSGSRNLRPFGAEIQDLASQCVGLLCDPKPGESWWDVCAGAGGKSLHLADLMENRGSIFATDIREYALEELRRRANHAGSGIISVASVSDRRSFFSDRKSPPQFDGVLVDAPCSGIGTWSRNPDARWRTPVNDVRDRARIQAELLRESAEKVRPGGRLVYAVCTMTRMETIDRIDAFFRERGDFALEEVPHPLTKKIGQGTFWIWPWDGPCDGMFVARMQRQEYGATAIDDLSPRTLCHP